MWLLLLSPGTAPTDAQQCWLKDSQPKDKLEQMKKDLPTACLPPSFATVVMDKQVIGCDEVGAASVAQVS